MRGDVCVWRGSEVVSMCVYERECMCIGKD